MNGFFVVLPNFQNPIGIWCAWKYLEPSGHSYWLSLTLFQSVRAAEEAFSRLISAAEVSSLVNRN